MMFNIYTIYDTVAKESGPIFASKNEGTAIRQFKNLMADTHNKAEYKLYKVGEYYPEDIKLLQCSKVEIKITEEKKDGKKNIVGTIPSDINNTNS